VNIHFFGAKAKGILPAAFILAILLTVFPRLETAQAQTGAMPLPIYLAPRQDGLPGTGKENDPYDVSTQPKFDTLFRKLYLSQGAYEFHFAPGTYLTLGGWGNYGYDNWVALSNWKFYGAGIDRTVLKLAGYRYLKPEDKIPAAAGVIGQAPWGRRGIEVKDLTIDCNWTGFAARTTAPFTPPDKGALAELSVDDAPKLAIDIGKYVFLQNPDRSKVGIYTLVSINNIGSITVRNDVSDPPGYGIRWFHGAVVPAGCLVAPYLNTTGIGIGSIDSIVERVHVTNTGAPVYEGPLGIFIGALKGEYEVRPASGNIIRDCLVDNLWGESGWGIAIASNNPDTGDDGTFIEGVVEGNTVLSTNGTHQGFSGWGTGHVVWRNNVARDCFVGWFEDSGYNRNLTIEKNLFDNNHIGIQFSAGTYWKESVIRNNRIIIPSAGIGIWSNGNVTDSTIENNAFISIGKGVAIQANPVGSYGNTISGNRISPSLSLSVGAEYLKPAPTGAQ